MSLLNEFHQLVGWDQHYAWLTRQGTNPLPQIDKNKAVRVPNCSSGLWYIIEIQNDLLYIHPSSEATIVRGLMKLIMDIVNGTPVTNIQSKLKTISGLNLNQYLSYSRRNGLAAIIKAIDSYSINYLKSLTART